MTGSPTYMLKIRINESTVNKSYKDRVDSSTTLPTFYDIVYSINESYYNNMLQYLQEDKKSALRRGLESLIDSIKKFDRFAIQRNKLLHVQARTIERYVQKERIHHPTTSTFANRQYHVPSDMKLLVPVLPSDIYKKMNILDQIKLAINDKKVYKKVNTKLFFIGQLPLWFTTYQTPEDMSQYLLNNTPGFIYEGVYNVNEIIELIKKFSSKALKYYMALMDKIRKEKDHLDWLIEDIQLAKKKLLQQNNKQRALELFKMYDACIDLIYMQLSIYQRAIIMIYGRAMSEMGDLIQTIYDDINDPEIKSYLFADEIDLTNDEFD